MKHNAFGAIVTAAILGMSAHAARADEPPPSTPAPAAPVVTTTAPPLDAAPAPIPAPVTPPPGATPVPVATAPAPDLSLSATTYPAEEARTVAWKPEWKKFSTPEVLLTSGLLLGTGAFILLGNPEAGPNWRGPILFDAGVRDVMRVKSESGRKNAQLVGDTFYYGGLAYPFLVDVVAVTLIGHRAPEVAAQMTLINTEAFAITGFLSFLSNATIRRERPYMRECTPDGPDPGFPGCAKGGAAEGFFSGHTAIAFTGAGLTCMHHANLPLYGKSGVGGIIACVSTMAGATAGGVLRLSADKHYVSDVIVGAGIGLASGLIVPWLHYRGGHGARAGSGKPASPVSWLPAPMLSPSTAGVAAFGTF